MLSFLDIISLRVSSHILIDYGSTVMTPHIKDVVTMVSIGSLSPRGIPSLSHYCCQYNHCYHCDIFFSLRFSWIVLRKNAQRLQLELSTQKLTTFYVQWCTIILRPKIGLCRRCWNLLMYTARVYWYSRESPWKSIVPLRPLNWLCKQGQLFP